MKECNTNQIVITKKSVINKMQERHGLLNNHLLTESPMPLPEIYQKSVEKDKKKKMKIICHLSQK